MAEQRISTTALAVRAVDTHCTLRITYTDRRGEATVREVAPYRVQQDACGRVYVWAYCNMRKEERTFRVDRIESAELGDAVEPGVYRECKRLQYQACGKTLAVVMGIA